MTEALQRTGLALLAPLTDPGSRTFWPLLLLAAGVGCVLHFWKTRQDEGSLGSKIWAGVGGPLWSHRSSVLDLQLLIARRLLGLLGLIPRLGSAYLLATGMVRWLDRHIGVPSPPDLPPLILTILYTLALFVVWACAEILGCAWWCVRAWEDGDAERATAAAAGEVLGAI